MFGTKKLIIFLSSTILFFIPMNTEAKLLAYFIEPIKKLDIRLGINSAKVDPMKEWYEKLNNDFRNGQIYSGIPANPEDWRQIESPKDIFTFNISAGAKIFSTSKFDLLCLVGSEAGIGRGSDYNREYTLANSTDSVYIDRFENYNLQRIFLGLKVRKEIIPRLNLSLGANYDFYKVEGNAYVSFGEPFWWRTPERESNFQGKNQGFSLSSSLEYQLRRHFSIATNLDYRWATIQTRGRETVADPSTGQTSSINPYNPKFRFDSFYSGIEFRYKFSPSDLPKVPVPVKEKTTYLIFNQTAYLLEEDGLIFAFPLPLSFFNFFLDYNYAGKVQVGWAGMRNLLLTLELEKGEIRGISLFTINADHLYAKFKIFEDSNAEDNSGKVASVSFTYRVMVDNNTFNIFNEFGIQGMYSQKISSALGFHSGIFFPFKNLLEISKSNVYVGLDYWFPKWQETRKFGLLAEAGRNFYFGYNYFATTISWKPKRMRIKVGLGIVPSREIFLFTPISELAWRF